MSRRINFFAAIILAGLSTAAKSATDIPVTLRTSTGALEGTLLVPQQQRPPVVLIIAGSGPTDRNGNGPTLRTDCLKQLAEGLASRGVASLRYDKRGVGQSRGAAVSESELRFETLVEDASGWIDLLLKDGRFSSVSVIGHSEGAQMAALVSTDGRVRRVVTIGGIAQRPSIILRQQLQRNLPPDLLASSETVLQALESGKRVADVPQALAALFRPSVQPYLISWFAHDPAETFRRLSVPALIVHGTTDTQVSQSEANQLAAANKQSKLLLIDGMNHVMKQSSLDPQDQRRAYTDPSVPIRQQAVDGIADFLLSGP